MIVEEGRPEYLPLAAFGVPLAGGVHADAVSTSGMSAGQWLAWSWGQIPPELRTPLLGTEPAPFGRVKVYVGALSDTLRFSSIKVSGTLGGLFDNTTDTIFDRTGTYLMHEWGHYIDSSWKIRAEGAATRSRVCSEPLWQEFWLEAKSLASVDPYTNRVGMTNDQEFFADVMQAWIRRNGDQLRLELSSNTALTRRVIPALAARFPFAGMQTVVNWNFD